MSSTSVYTDDDTPVKQPMELSPNTMKKECRNGLDDENYQLQYQKGMKNLPIDIKSNLEKECGLTPSTFD
jgi:hypothetical protein